MKKKTKVLKAFMCSTDFELELEARNRVKVYPTLKLLRDNVDCVCGRSSKKDKRCGIYEVSIAVTVTRVVRKPSF